MKLRNILVCTGLLLASGLVLSSPQVDVKLTSPIVASADTTGYCGDNVTFSFDSSTGTLTLSGTGSTYDYEFDNYRPTLWDDYLDKIKTVVIKNGVTNIGKELFRNCTALTSVSIPSSVTSIDYRAFRNCTSLKSITIPNSITFIGEYAFNGCTSLTKVTISDSVTEIGNYAFMDCTSLTSVTIPNSVTSIGGCAFEFCTSLESITIPDSVTSIGNTAFYGCASLKSITIPNSVTSIGICVFENCTSLKNVTIPNSVTSIDNRAFKNCTSLESIIIPDSVRSIGGGAFYNCTALESIVIPDSVVSIKCVDGYINGIYNNYLGTFGNCTSLKSVVISDNVTSIPQTTFYNCTALESVTLGNSTTEIDKEAFANCISLKEISIPGMVQNVGTNAFENCTSLKSVAFENYITIDGKDYYFKHDTTYDLTLTIQQNAFKGCTSLSDVTLSENTSVIGKYAFIDCTSLRNITFYNSSTTINDYAIGYTNNGSSYTRLSNVTINAPSGSTAETYAKYNGFTYNQFNNSLEHTNTVTSYRHDYIFYSSSSIHTNDGTCYFLGSDYITQNDKPDMTNVKVLVIGGDITCISRSAFSGCTSLENVKILNSVTSIGEYAFGGCTSLKSITIPNSVTSIGEYAFTHCTSLESVTIPNSVSIIGAGVFFGCTSLKSITIPNSVSIIGAETFYDCMSLTNVYFEGTEEEWKNIWKNTAINIGNNYLADANIYYANATPITGSCGNKITYTLDYETLTMTISGTGAMKDYSSDSDVPWYEYRNDIRKVVIENGVTNIGDYAFYGCTYLKNITIPHSVTSIGSCAFKNCTSLESITVPDSVTSIGESAFYDCTALVYVYLEIEDGGTINITVADNNGYFSRATRINKLYGNCGSNATYTINNGTLTMTISGTGAMENYSNDSDVPWYRYREMIKKVVIESGTTSIGKYTFSDCVGLKKITIPNSVTSINSCALKNCTSLTDVYFEGTEEEWRNIDIGNYNNCLTNATIHYNSTNCVNKVTFSFDNSTGTLTISGTGAMEDYSSDNSAPWHNYKEKIKTVVIGDGVTSIGDFAFDHCTSLESVTIPDSVTSIGVLAFFDCTALKNITIPDSVTSIDFNAFSSCISLKNITIPDSVTSIDWGAFCNCTSLERITIPNSVTSIYDGAFEDCTALTDVYFEGTEEEWNSIEIKSGNDYLTSATINYGNTTPQTTTATTTTATTTKTTTKTTTTPPTTTTKTTTKTTTTQTNIDNYGDNVTFSFDSSTDTLTISGTGAMKDYSYYSDVPWNEYREDIKTVVIEDGVTSIGSMAFIKCSSLKSITIPDSVTSIGEYAFYGCTTLTDVYFEGTEEKWHNVDVDGYNSDLTNATIYYSGTTPQTTTATTTTNINIGSCGDNVTSVFDTSTGTLTISGTGAMEDYYYYSDVPWNEYINDIRTVAIEDGVTSIGSMAFIKCSSLKSITIPDSVTSIGEHAFYGCTTLTDVYFEGTEKEWHNININGYNSNLTNATIYYINDTQEPTTTTLLLLKRRVLGIFSSNSNSLDLNGDGSVNDLDLIVAKQKLFSK